MELQKLEVLVIMDPQCDNFPNITSDESCEYLCHGNGLYTKLLVTYLSNRSWIYSMNCCELLTSEFIIIIFKKTIRELPWQYSG